MIPVQELRRGAVQRLIDAAKSKDAGGEAKAGYLEALDAVRDEDQTKFIAARAEEARRAGRSAASTSDS